MFLRCPGNLLTVSIACNPLKRHVLRPNSTIMVAGRYMLLAGLSMLV